jgi:hypothetical protein
LPNEHREDPDRTLVVDAVVVPAQVQLSEYERGQIRVFEGDLAVRHVPPTVGGWRGAETRQVPVLYLGQREVEAPIDSAPPTTAVCAESEPVIVSSERVPASLASVRIGTTAESWYAAKRTDPTS